MPIRALFAFLLVLSASGQTRAAESLVIKESAFDVGETLDRLEAAAKERGLTIFGRIDHAAGARKVGRSLPPTQLLIFGNPKVGTPLMESARTIGLDLPLRVLAWEETDGAVKLAYTKPAALADRYGVTDREDTLATMTGALDKLTDEAAGR